MAVKEDEAATAMVDCFKKVRLETLRVCARTSSTLCREGLRPGDQECPTPEVLQNAIVADGIRRPSEETCF